MSILPKDSPAGCDSFGKAKNNNCPDHVPGKIDGVVLFPKGDVIPSAELVPTPAEIQAYINSEPKAVFLRAAVTKPDGTPFSIGADVSESGFETRLYTEESLELRINNLSPKLDAMLDDIADNVREMQVLYVTENGFCYGTNTGYNGSVSFDKDKKYDGRRLVYRMGVINFIQTPKKRNIYNPNGDLDYRTLDNIATIGIYTVTNETGTSGNAFTNWEGINGWLKDDYPALYFEMTTADVLTAFPTSADRTAGTNALFSVDTTVNGNLTELNASGFNGVITIVNTSVVLNNTFTVTYS